jgi:hypothetical protein
MEQNKLINETNIPEKFHVNIDIILMQGTIVAE